MLLPAVTFACWIEGLLSATYYSEDDPVKAKPSPLMCCWRKLSGVVKGLQRQRLIGSAVAGLNHAKTIIKASATDLHARQDDYNKGI